VNVLYPCYGFAVVDLKKSSIPAAVKAKPRPMALLRQPFGQVMVGVSETETER
jgi:hypothetical protein